MMNLVQGFWPPFFNIPCWSESGMHTVWLWWLDMTYDCDLLHLGSLAALWATRAGGKNLSRSELMRWHFLFLWRIVLCAVMYLDVMPTKHEARAICVCRVLATGASKGKLRPGDVWMLSTIDIHWPDVDEAWNAALTHLNTLRSFWALQVKLLLVL